MRSDTDFLRLHSLASPASAAALQPPAIAARRIAVPPLAAPPTAAPAAPPQDALTGLAPRALLLERTARAVRAARIAGRQVALLVIDIDGFNDINGALGTAVGDWYLRTCAERLRAATYLGHTVARIGNDEFAVLLDGGRDREELRTLAVRLLGALAEPACHGSDTVAATASAGLAVFPADGADEHALLGRAGIALAHARAEGGNAHAFYAPAMEGAGRRSFCLNQGLRAALAADQLDLHYQPIVALDAGLQVRGLEALMRWTLPGGDRVPPSEFIPLAERSGAIVRLGQHALRRACGQIGAWQRAGLAPVPVAVNLSPRQLAHPDLVDTVFAALEDNGLAPESMALEITESAAMAEDDAELRAKLRRFADRGMRLAIDDFGTGYSSLARLSRLPVHTLKIDRGFVQGLSRADPQPRALIHAIVGLARALGLQTVAEGVETREQLELLREAGCDCCQGYLISRPVDGVQARRLLAARG